MRYTKKTVADIAECYAVAAMMLGGEPCLFFGGEGEGSLQVFYGENYHERDQIWLGGGGTMSIAPLQTDPPMLLASRGFFSMVEARTSTIEIIRWTDGRFHHQRVASLPYLHRFDVLTAPDGGRYILAATIASHKENKEDWSRPGHLYGAELPQNLSAPFSLELTVLPGDYFMNHGFYKTRSNGADAAYTASREGVFCVLPPKAAGKEWTISKILHEPISDIAVCDIDLDGEPEIAAILPFHGDTYKIFKKKNGAYAPIFTHPDRNDFYHTVTAGSLNRKPVFIGGARGGEATLFMLTWDDSTGAFISRELDRGRGASAALLFNAPGKDILVCANREVSQAAVYEFDPA